MLNKLKNVLDWCAVCHDGGDTLYCCDRSVFFYLFVVLEIFVFVSKLIFFSFQIDF